MESPRSSSQLYVASSDSIQTPTPKTGVDLNITSDIQSTDKFDYKNVGQYVTYSPKGHNAFKLVKDGNTELWHAIDAINYCGRVDVEFLVNEGKAVTIYFHGNKTKVFRKDGTSNPWREIDVPKLVPKKMNINYPYDIYFYTNVLDNNVRTFTAKTGYAFDGSNEYIDGDRVEIWKTDKESEYANKIEVDLMNNDAKAVTLYICDNKTRIFLKRGKKQPWNEIDMTKVNAKSANIRYNYDTYVYTNKFDNGVRTFTPKTGFSFNGVRDGNTQIWSTSNEKEYANKVVSAERYSGFLDVKIYLANGNKKLFVKESDNEGWKEIDITKLNPEPVDINYEHETHSYKNEYKGYYRKFTAKKGFTFSSAYDCIYGNKVEIWKANNESEYVNRIEYMGEEKLIIYIGDDGTAKVIEKGSDGKWPREFSGDIHPYKHDYETSSHSITTGTSTPETIESSETHIEEEDVNAGSSSPAFNISHDGETDPANQVSRVTVEADEEMTSADGIVSAPEDEAPEGSGSAAPAADAVLASGEASEAIPAESTDAGSSEGFEASADTAELGSLYPDTYGSGVVIGGKSGDSADADLAEAETVELVKAVVDFRGSGSQPAKTPSDSNPTGTSTPKTGVDLNINSDKRSNKRLEYRKIGQYVVYTAKPNYSFKLVKDGNTELWHASHSDNYCGRVEVDLINNDAKAVTLYFPINKTKVFVKDGTNEPWKEIDTSKINRRSVYIDYEHESYISKNDLKGKIRTFTPKPGFSFNGAHEYINDNRVAVWKTNNETEYANKIEVDLIDDNSKAITIHLGENKTKVFVKDGKNELWKEVDTTEVNPKTLDITDDKETYFYFIKVDNNVRTFVAKTGFSFNGVREGDNYIWTTSKEKEYAKKVVEERNNLLIIYMGDNDTAKFFTGKMIYGQNVPQHLLQLHNQKGVNCTQLIFDGVLVWKHDPNLRDGKYPKSVYHDTSTDGLVIRFAGLDMDFAKNAYGTYYELIWPAQTFIGSFDYD
ncbi:hypothetical protein MACJ_001588 [Theileria orientalis]|uniref:Uncharacterized protein n=1 Tax=Theileria orientalis TaxID=68886 RepID=A0A976M8T8_THEOR|nr:hypothetical protein MACJ_001588 [Theileria orientalis]